MVTKVAIKSKNDNRLSYEELAREADEAEKKAHNLRSQAEAARPVPTDGGDHKYPYYLRRLAGSGSVVPEYVRRESTAANMARTELWGMANNQWRRYVPSPQFVIIRRKTRPVFNNIPEGLMNRLKVLDRILSPDSLPPEVAALFAVRFAAVLAEVIDESFDTRIKLRRNANDIQVGTA